MTDYYLTSRQHATFSKRWSGGAHGAEEGFVVWCTPRPCSSAELAFDTMAYGIGNWHL
jgi:hypothetical protein